MAAPEAPVMSWGDWLTASKTPQRATDRAVVEQAGQPSLTPKIPIYLFISLFVSLFVVL